MGVVSAYVAHKLDVKTVALSAKKWCMAACGLSK